MWRNLAVGRLQHVGVGSLQHAGLRARESCGCGEARGVFAQSCAAAAGFDANHFHARIAEKRVEEADRVRSAAHAGKKIIGQAAFGAQNLLRALPRR